VCPHSEDPDLDEKLLQQFEIHLTEDGVYPPLSPSSVSRLLFFYISRGKVRKVDKIRKIGLTRVDSADGHILSCDEEEMPL